MLFRSVFAQLSTLVFAITISAIPVSAATGNLKAESHITAVTIYSDRATVTRETEIQIPAGSSAIYFEGLSATLFTNSLRAQGSAPVAVVIGAVENKMVSGAELAAPRERELNTKLQELQDKRALVAAEGEALAARRKFLDALGQQAETASKENFAHLDLHPDQWNAAGNVIYNGTNEIVKASANLVVTLREMDKQIIAVQKEMNQLRTGQRSTMRVTIPVESKEATTLKLKISYQLPAATWQPIYDARLDTASGKVILTQFGEVRQATGEDWNNVALTLSTAQPARGALLPTLTTMWLSIYDNAVRALADAPAMMVRADKAKEARFQEMDALQEKSEMNGSAVGNVAEAAPVPVEMAFQNATIETGGYVSEYKIPGSVTITADNSARKLMIGTLENSSTLLAQLRPALSANAYLIARTKLGGEAPLMPGNVNLFRDGVFIGNSFVSLLRPGEEANLSFGIDDDVVAKRQILADTRGSDGVIAKSTTRERKTLTTIQNLHKFLVKTEVLEVLPVSQDDKIKIDILEEATTPNYTKDVDNTTGLAKWTFDLAAGGKNEVKLGWRVSWPEGKQIMGMP